MSQVRDFARRHTMWLSLGAGMTIIPFAFAQILAAIGVWNWLSQLHDGGDNWLFWGAFCVSRIVFGLIWFVSWRALEDLGIKLGFLKFEDEVFGNLLPTPKFALWGESEHVAFAICLFLIDFSVAEVAIALYTLSAPPYFG